MTDYSSRIEHISPMLDGKEHHYSDELTLDIDDSGVSVFVRTRYSSDNGIPMDVWHGRRREYVLATGPAVIALDQIREDLKDGGKLSILIDRIRAGHSVDWDGSNFRGKLNDDADEADRELDSMINDDWRGNPYVNDGWSVWDESEYAYDAMKTEVKSDWTNERIEEWLTEIRSFADGDCVMLTGDATEYVREYRDKLRAEAEEANAE